MTIVYKYMKEYYKVEEEELFSLVKMIRQEITDAN